MEETRRSVGWGSYEHKHTKIISYRNSGLSLEDKVFRHYFQGLYQSGYSHYKFCFSVKRFCVEATTLQQLSFLPKKCQTNQQKESGKNLINFFRSSNNLIFFIAYPPPTPPPPHTISSNRWSQGSEINLCLWIFIDRNFVF